jgi:predicted HAD superfamily Cof-like phosphohydrolase
MIKSEGNTINQHCFISCPPEQYCKCKQQINNQKYNMNKQVPFVNEVQQFNEMMGKSFQNRTTPTIDKKDADFVINFIKEELEELEEAVANGDIVEVLDAILDITYVCLGNGAMSFGLKDKIMAGYAEVQRSNLSKICKTEEEAKHTCTIRSLQQEEEVNYRKEGDGYVCYRVRDNKIMKNVNWSEPDLKSLFTEQEIESCKNK